MPLSGDISSVSPLEIDALYELEADFAPNDGRRLLEGAERYGIIAGIQKPVERRAGWY